MTMLAGCGGDDPGLIERIDRLEADLRSRDDRIGELEQKIEASKSAGTRAARPSASAVEEAFAREAVSLRRQIEQLAGPGRLADYSLSSVESVDLSRPYSATITLTMEGDGGAGNVRVKGKAFADESGRWKLPSAQDMLAAAQQAARQAKEEARSQSTTIHSGSTGGSGRPGPAQATPQDVMGAGQTIQIDWGDAPRQNTRSAPTSAPQPPAAPPGEAPTNDAGKPSPQKVMPVDRDITISW